MIKRGSGHDAIFGEEIIENWKSYNKWWCAKRTKKIKTSEEGVKGTNEVHKRTENIKTNGEVDKGTEKLEYMEEAVVTIRRKDSYKFDGKSKGSTLWFNLDHEF